MDATEKQEILEAIGRVDEKLDAKIREDEGRFQRLEDDVTEVRERLAARAKQDANFADQMTKVSAAAAHAAEIGLSAMRRASESENNATQIVKSALAIHNASIAARGTRRSRGTRAYMLSSETQPVAPSNLATEVTGEVSARGPRTGGTTVKITGP